MSNYILLEDGTFAEQNLPDPRAIYTPEQLAEVKTQKEQEVGMYESEITHLQERKAKLEAEILEITNLLQ